MSIIANIANLKKITEEIISTEQEEKNLIESCQTLQNLFYKVSGMADAKTMETNGIKTPYGVALGTVDAAACIIDAVRTRVFLKSLKEAIEDAILDSPGKPVNVLYAGTGPFATLLTPLTTLFTPLQLQMFLIEINPQSIAYLRATVKQLDIEKYVTDIIEADASDYQLPSGYAPDIIVSETMLQALRTEPQVMICANLINQCSKKVLLIPQMIQVSAALINIDADNEQEIKTIKTLLEYDAQTALMIKENKKGMPIFAAAVEFIIPELHKQYSHVALLTNIQVYKKNWILYGQSSGLTMPYLVMDLKSIKKWPAVFRATYNLGTDPGFQISM